MREMKKRIPREGTNNGLDVDAAALSTALRLEGRERDVRARENKVLQRRHKGGQPRQRVHLADLLCHE